MNTCCNTVLRIMSLVVSLGWLLPSLASAEFYVCGDATQFTQAFYRDPSLTRPTNCSPVPLDQVDAQVTLIQSVAPPNMTPARYDYLKVVGAVPNGLVAMKTPAEKQAADDALLAQQQAQQALAQERQTNLFCNQQDVNAGTTAVAQRKTDLYAKIDTISAVNVATMKTALKQVVDELASVSTYTINCFTGRKGGS